MFSPNPESLRRSEQGCSGFECQIRESKEKRKIEIGALKRPAAL